MLLSQQYVVSEARGGAESTRATPRAGPGAGGAKGITGWSGLIKRATGEMTITLADTKGAYVAFGQCKIAGASADSATKKGAN